MLRINKFPHEKKIHKITHFLPDTLFFHDIDFSYEKYFSQMFKIFFLVLTNTRSRTEY